RSRFFAGLLAGFFTRLFTRLFTGFVAGHLNRRFLRRRLVASEKAIPDISQRISGSDGHRHTGGTDKHDKGSYSRSPQQSPDNLPMIVPPPDGRGWGRAWKSPCPPRIEGSLRPVKDGSTSPKSSRSSFL